MEGQSNSNPDSASGCSIPIRSPISKADKRWHLKTPQGMIEPYPGLNQRLCEIAYGSNHCDLVVRVRFREESKTSEFQAHRCMHLWAVRFAGGLLAQAFDGAKPGVDVELEGNMNQTEWVCFKRFLYGCPFSVKNVTLPSLMNLISHGSRYKLKGFLRVMATAIQQMDRIATPGEIVEASFLFKIAGIPRSFKNYLLNLLAEQYQHFFDNKYADGDATVSIEKRLCPGFLVLWPLMENVGMSALLLKKIMEQDASPAIRKGLVDCVLDFIQPRRESDEEVMVLLDALELSLEELEVEVSSGDRDANGNSRAMRILAKYAIAKALTRTRPSA